jgi:hypothetical protein
MEAQRPIMAIEAVNVDGAKPRSRLERPHHSVAAIGINLLAIHKSDAGLARVKVVAPAA